jgi:hypothetical protein
VAFINQAFHGFVGTQRKIVFKEIQFFCHLENQRAKKVTNLDNFSDSDVSDVTDTGCTYDDVNDFDVNDAALAVLLY